MAESNYTSGLMSLDCPKTIHGSNSLHISDPMPSNLPHPLGSFYTAATHRLFLLLIRAPVQTPPSGRSNSSNHLLGLVASTMGHLPRSFGNGSRSKPSTKVYMIERRSSRRKALLLYQMVTYAGTHRSSHSHSTLK